MREKALLFFQDWGPYFARGPLFSIVADEYYSPKSVLVRPCLRFSETCAVHAPEFMDLPPAAPKLPGACTARVFEKRKHGRTKTDLGE